MDKEMRFDVDVEYVRIPHIRNDEIVLIVDPMVATASTMETVLNVLVRYGKAKQYIIVSAITTPIAIKRLEKISKELNINLKLYTASIDPEVNDKGYIVPGLGDAGDRAFGGA